MSFVIAACLLASSQGVPQEPVQLSGIYPHLAVYNSEDECGIGGVVPWAGGLWMVTYAPHRPRGSTDKLYRVGADLQLAAHPASIGGTPANRMIHEESAQLFLGPYAIDESGAVRVLPYAQMPGRPTGNARHLTAPSDKLLYATMEEGFYEVDVRSLAVTELWADVQAGAAVDGRQAALPGYHGKGFYSGQGVYVYANNGEYGAAARRDPAVASGVLAEWDGEAANWTVVRRNQFTEVTGPGGLRGSAAPATDPIWTVGWDHRSLLLGVRSAETGAWRFVRLPKSSHAYDGAHGWNTEWPRIRDVGERDLLMTMHGALWRFPRGFGVDTWRGIVPRSNYLKVVGDFCGWGGRVVFGCDDHARSAFLNQRRAKGKIAAGQSHSNLWFVERDRLGRLGPALGRGAVWLDEDVPAGQPSDPLSFEGFDLCGLHLHHQGERELTLSLELGELGERGRDRWEEVQKVSLPPGGYRFVALPAADPRPWLRLVPSSAARGLTAAFNFRQSDARGAAPSARFDGLATSGEPCSGGLLRARGGDLRTLSLLACTPDGEELGYYELDGDLQLRRTDTPEVAKYTREHAAIPRGVLQIDAASVRYVDDDGRAWRLPRGGAGHDRPTFGAHRVDREVVTERDLFHAHGTFYELPADNAGGFQKVRPVATHSFQVHDYCGYRGLLVLSGVAAAAPADNPHVLRSDDGRCAVWAGAVDDLWELGKPRGQGGPWLGARVVAGAPSEPYLMTGYDRKELRLSADRDVTVTVQLDVSGDGHWCTFRRYRLSAEQQLVEEWPRELSAYWVRFLAGSDCVATAQLTYR